MDIERKLRANRACLFERWMSYIGSLTVMKRFLATVLVSCLVFSLGSSAANAAIKLGASCKSLKARTVFSGYEYTCVKSGKKLIWSIGVKVTIKPAVAPTVVPKTIPKAFKAPMPIELPVSQTGPITFANITDHVSEIPKVAWQSVQDLIATNKAPSVQHEVFVGPNTPLSISGGIPRIDSTIDRLSKLWSGFASTSRFSLVYFNLGDEKWAIQKVRDIWAKNGYRQSSVDGFIHGLEIMCQQQAAPGVGGAALGYCQGANAGIIENSTDSLGTFGEGSVQHPDTYGSIVAHELIHTYQHAQWINSPSCKTRGMQCSMSGLSHEFAPCWLSEGQPNSINSMAAITDFATYLTDRPSGLDTSQKIVEASESSIKKFLYDQNPSTCYRNGALYQQGYGPGAMAIEALVAIAGPQATMALFSLGAEGQDFATAFKNVYGITWDEGSTIIAKVLEKEYSQAR